MNLLQRERTVFQALSGLGKLSFRRLAQATGLSKSSVARLYHRLTKRNQHPESALWETEAGQKWLRLLVLAAIFVFALEGGLGCERLSRFFHLLRLENHIGVSPTALRSLRTQMEEKILAYQQQHQLCHQEQTVEICAAADETFFEQVVLVMLDLASGYIFIEQFTDNRQYETWQQQVQQALAPMGLKVKYLVSDRAKALVKLALNDLGVPSIADLFHVLLELSRSIGWELNTLLGRLHKQLKRASEQSAPPELIEQLEASQQVLLDSLESYQKCRRDISLVLHPFAISDSQTQTTKEVKASLSSSAQTLEALRQTHQLRDRRNSLQKFKGQISALAAVIDLWWDWVNSCLNLAECSPSIREWACATASPSYLLATATSTDEKSRFEAGRSNSLPPSFLFRRPTSCYR